MKYTEIGRLNDDLLKGSVTSQAILRLDDFIGICGGGVHTSIH